MGGLEICNDMACALSSSEKSTLNNAGSLKGVNKSYAIFPFSNTEEVSEQAYHLIKKNVERQQTQKLLPLTPLSLTKDNSLAKVEYSLFSKCTAGVDIVQSEKVEIPTPELQAPELPAPELPSFFGLYFMLDKLQIQSESSSYGFARQEIDELDKRLEKVHQDRIEQLKKARTKEKQVERWSIFAKTMTIMASVSGIFSGVALIATGAGAIAGAMLIVAGIFAISTQIMELTGGWNKVADLLPGDDVDQKRGIISWLQIGVAVFSIILSVVTFIFGGFFTLSESMKIVMQAFNGIVSIAQGVATIGAGSISFQYKNRLANINEFDMALTELRYMREDLMELIESTADRMEKMIEYIGETLSIQKEIFKSQEMVWR